MFERGLESRPRRTSCSSRRCAQPPTEGPVKLFGTTTSPYTRKIRILGRAAGLDATLVDTRTDEGADGPGARRAARQGARRSSWRATGPRRACLPDSGLIAAWLWARHARRAARRGLRPLARRLGGARAPRRRRGRARRRHQPLLPAARQAARPGLRHAAGRPRRDGARRALDARLPAFARPSRPRRAVARLRARLDGVPLDGRRARASRGSPPSATPGTPRASAPAPSQGRAP